MSCEQTIQLTFNKFTQERIMVSGVHILTSRISLPRFIWKLENFKKIISN